MKKIAFFGVGMIGTGPYGRGIPTLRKLLQNLSMEYSVVVYRMGQGEHPGGLGAIKLRTVPPFPLPQKVQYLLIAAYFLLDHLQSPFSVIHALSAAPAGRLAVLLGKVFKLPVAVHLHSAEAVHYPSFNHGDLLQPKLREMTQRVCNNADALTVLSKFQEQVVRQNLSLDKPIVVIPRGLDLAQFQFNLATPGKCLRLLFVGYPEPVKDPWGALDVFIRISRTQDATLTVVGEGLTFDRFADQLTKAGITDKVSFRGALSYEDLKKVYAAVDVLLVTSRYESQSAVALEAMACGVLVCGAHVGILADLSGEACLTVQPENYPGLADLILDLWQSPERQTNLRKQARQWVETHDSNWTAKQYVALMDSLLNKQA